MQRSFAILLGLSGLGLGFVALFGALMIAVPPVKPPEGVQPDCCLQFLPLLLLVPLMVLTAFGFSATALWTGRYPAWRGNWKARMLLLLHGLSWLVTLAILWIWVMGVLLV